MIANIRSFHVDSARASFWESSTLNLIVSSLSALRRDFKALFRILVHATISNGGFLVFASPLKEQLSNLN